MTQRVSAPVAAALGVFAAAVVGSLAIALLPLHANGVSGNAFAPHYHPFSVGVYSYQPLPEHVTIAQLRRLGVRVPQDAVDRRRRIAAGLLAAGLAVSIGAGLATAVRAGRRAAEGSPAG